MLSYLSREENMNVIKTNHIGNLGYIADGCPFIVPITYFYDAKENCVFSFTSIGHKVESMRKNSTVCLLINEIDGLKVWKTVQIHGTFEELNEKEGTKALKKIEKKFIEEFDTSESAVKFLELYTNKKFPQNKTIVYRIELWDVTGRFMG